MKKIIVLGLALTIILGIASMASAVSVSPEFGAMYHNSAGNPMAVGGGVLIKVAPMVGIRIRGAYQVKGGGGYLIPIDVMFSYPVHPKVDVNVGGGVNICDSTAANVGIGYGGQFYGGITAKMAEKIGFFVDAGYISRANSNARANSFGMAFGVRANLGGE